MLIAVIGGLIELIYFWLPSCCVILAFSARLTHDLSYTHAASCDANLFTSYLSVTGD